VSRRSGLLPSWTRPWAADSAVLLLSQLAAIVATSALAILLARHLGPDDWGIFSGFLGLSLGLSVFVEFGLTQWLLRELSRLWTQEGESDLPVVRRRAGRIVVASFAVSLALSTAIILGAGAAAAGLHLKTNSALLVVALVAYGGLLAVCSGLETVFRARRRLARVVGALLLEKGSLLLLVSLALLLELGLVAIGIAYVLAGLVRVTFDIAGIIQTGDVTLSSPSVRITRYVMRKSVRSH
jgi:O-antigen/teichoic acid export membrane protein